MQHQVGQGVPGDFGGGDQLGAARPLRAALLPQRVQAQESAMSLKVQRFRKVTQYNIEKTDIDMRWESEGMLRECTKIFALTREWLWVVLICVAAIIATYAFLLVRCIFDRSCNRGTKEQDEEHQSSDQEHKVVCHRDPTMC